MQSNPYSPLYHLYQGSPVTCYITFTFIKVNSDKKESHKFSMYELIINKPLTHYQTKVFTTDLPAVMECIAA